MSKSYFVSHVQRHGFWIVCCNDHGHYREFGKYTNRAAAVKAADLLNAQTRGEAEHGSSTFDMMGAI
jgi:hypothetical protein